MLHNRNILTRIEDESEIPESLIKIVQFSAFDFDHTLEVQPFAFINLDLYNKNDWRNVFLRVNELPQGIRTYAYDPVPGGVPDFNKLDTMWYVYECLRLELLENNPDWIPEKLINLVPKEPVV